MNELAKNIAVLFNDLLLWSAVNTGHIVHKPERLNIADLLKFQIEFLRQTARNKAIDINSEISDVFISADKMMIETVIRNLISNAIKFTNPQGRIFVGNYSIDAKVVVEIEDTGVGMEENEINKLFKPYEKISRKGTLQEKGIGLGLLICKEFINRNNGTIEVSSKKNAGTTFRFFLPIT
jgi:signal transduction histidine kinase